MHAAGACTATTTRLTIATPRKERDRQAFRTETSGQLAAGNVYVPKCLATPARLVDAAFSEKSFAVAMFSDQCPD